VNKYQRFFFIVALIGALIYYVAGVVLMTPPLHATLFGKEAVVVTASTVELRENRPRALVVVDVRDESGQISSLRGLRWNYKDAAYDMAGGGGLDVGKKIEVFRYRGQLWIGIHSLRDMILLFVSGFGAFLSLFGLWMVWKVRHAEVTD